MTYPVTGMGLRAAVLMFIGRALLCVSGLVSLGASWVAFDANRWMDAAALAAAGLVGLVLFAVSFARPRRAFILAMLMTCVVAAWIYFGGLTPAGFPPAILLAPCAFWLGPILMCEDPDGVFV